MVTGILFADHVSASTFELYFSGSLYHRVLDGGKNGQYYALYANKNLEVVGTATVTTDPSDPTIRNSTGNTTYAFCYCGTSSGNGTEICSTSFTVDRNDGCKGFSMSGTTKKAGSNYYLYFFKIHDDYIDLDLNGHLRSSN